MKNSYGKLKWVIMRRSMAATMITVFVGVFIMEFFVDGIFQDRFIRAFVRMTSLLGASERTGLRLYTYIFQQHKAMIVLLGFFLLFWLVFYMTLSGIGKYIDEVGVGMENILSDSDEPVSLSKPMQPMEHRLNTIKWKLKEKERMAQESEQKKNDLLVYLAHDLKTPLTSVIAYLGILDDSEKLPKEEREKYTHIALEKSMRLKELIDEFFEITRFNTQNLQIERERLDLSMMLEQIAEEFYAVLKQKDLRCEVDIEERLMVMGDPDKLARVFDNLLRNAISYSIPQTMIHITGSHEGDKVVIDCVNQGEPIPEHQLASLFEKFYRMDSARSTETGGAGLGLAIAKQIVTAHKGTIQAMNTQEGICFRVELPVPEEKEGL